MEVMTKDLLAMACKVPPSSASFSTLSSEEIKKTLSQNKKKLHSPKAFSQADNCYPLTDENSGGKCEANADRLLLSCSQPSSNYIIALRL